MRYGRGTARKLEIETGLENIDVFKTLTAPILHHKIGSVKGFFITNL